jgi:hypothetical protein
MFRKLSNQSALWMLAGICVGLGIALVFHGQPTYATATDHNDDFSIATGHLTNETEAVYLLDLKSGGLLGTVMNRQTGQFQQFFKRDLAADFVLNARQKPKFIMVTGAMQNAQAKVPINHVLYVAEFGSGKLCAYVMPYRGETVAKSNTEELMLVSLTSFRAQTPIRPQ